MQTRYFLIEPKYSDPDTFASFIFGSARMRASIDIYADLYMLSGVAAALRDPGLEGESFYDFGGFDDTPEWNNLSFNLIISVIPAEEGRRILRVRIWQEWLDDGAPYRSEVRFNLSREEALVMSKDLDTWCRNPQFTFSWLGG